MAVYLTNGRGEEFAVTSVRLPRGLFDAAKDRNVNFSRVMADSLAGIVGPGTPRTPRK
jgi:post-segregation antitoxin (ccd killing protein)